MTATRRIFIEWGDCDPAGIVYYPRYFEWFNESTAALFRAAGALERALIPMVDTRARFFLPSKYEEELIVETTLLEFRRSSFDIHHRMLKNGTLAVEGFETRVWAVRDPQNPERLRSEPVPAEIRARFSL